MMTTNLSNWAPCSLAVVPSLAARATHVARVASLAVLVAAASGGVRAQAQCEPHWSAGFSPSVPGANGSVTSTALIDESTGPAFYVGGGFTQIGTTLVQRLARLDLTSQMWSAVEPGVEGSVWALQALDGRLYVGGGLTKAGDLDVNGIAMWDPTSHAWSALGDGLTPQAQHAVRAMTALGDRLYVGGTFTQAGQTPANNIACWDPATQQWSALGEGLSGTPIALAVVGGKLYAGGDIAVPGGEVGARVVCWDPDVQTWSEIGSTFDGYPEYEAEVSAIAGDQGTLIVGGRFAGIDGVAAANIVRYDPATREWAPFGEGTSNTVFTLAVRDGSVYAGGFFRTASGVTVNGIARWETSTHDWHALGGGLLPRLWSNLAFATHIAFAGERILVAGDFEVAGGVPVKDVAFWNPDSQEWSGAARGTNDLVFALTTHDGKLYAGGAFTGIGDIAASGVACFDPATHAWSALGDGISGRGLDIGAHVRTMVWLDGRLYVAGPFTTAGGAPANHIACWDPSTQSWSTLHDGIGGTGAYPSAMTAFEGKLYVAGDFSSAGGIQTENIACWDPDTQTWSDLNVGTDGFVSCVAAFQGNLYIGGGFSFAGDVYSPSFARWDPTARQWYALRDMPNSSVTAMRVVDGKLYIAGDFTRVGGVNAVQIACWDPATQAWSPLGPGLGGYAAAVECLGDVDGALYVGGGLFNLQSHVKSTSIVGWDMVAQTWFGLDGGVRDSSGVQIVYSLAGLDGRLYAGGWFEKAGGLPSYYIAEWASPCPAADADRDGDVDLADFQGFLACFNGMDQPPAQRACDSLDADADGDVDLSDFASFMACFNGPNRPPSCGA